MSLLAKQDNRNAPVGSSGPAGSSRFKETLHLRLRSFREAVESGDVPEGTVWLVRVIEAGQSLNGPIYTPAALRAAVTVFEGAPVFNYAWSEDPAARDADHLPDEVADRDPRGFVGNQVGSLEGVHYNEQAQALDAYFKVYDGKLRERMLTAFRLGDIGEGGSRDTFGLSIDAHGDQDEAGNVTRITSANSVDLVSTPAAGGRIRRLVASMGYTEAALQEQATVRKVADGYGVFVDGKQVGSHETKQGAEECAAARNRMAGALEAPEDEVHKAMSESDKSTATAQGEVAEEVAGEQTEEKTMGTTKIKIEENAATFAGKLKLWADQLSTAPDADVPAMLEQISQAVMAAIEEIGMTGDPETEDESAMSQEAKSVKKDETVVAHATGDDFARMSAGLTEKLREALKSGDSVKLREAAIEVVGEEPKLDAKDQQIEALRERLKGQAIDRAMGKLTEELSLREGAAPVVLRLIDRSGLSFDDDFLEVNGLKEAIKAVLKDAPYFVTEQVQESASEAATPEAHQTESVTATAEAAVPLGQSVPLRESQRQITQREPTRGDVALLHRYEKRMLSGDHLAMKKHRDLRAQLGL